MKKALVGCALLAFLFSPAFSHASGHSGGRAFYVDASSGSDSNSGMSPSQPWQTLMKVNALRLRPGDTVYLKRGSLWRETLIPDGSGSAADPITITAYGSGAPPTISGADPVKSWSPYAGPIYAARLASRPINIYLDDTMGWGLTAANTRSVMPPGSWYWEGGTLYVRLPRDSDPSGHAIEAVVRPRAVFAQNRSYLTIDSLMTRRTGCWAIEMLAQNASRDVDSVISNNLVTQNGTNLVDTGGYCNAIYVNYATAPLVKGNTVSYAGGHNAIDVQNATDIKLLDNDVSQWNHNGLDTKMSIGVLYQGNRAHDAPHGNGIYSEVCSNITVDNNTIYNIQGNTNGNSNGIHIGYRTGGRIEIAHNSIRNTFGGIYLRSPANSQGNAIETRSGLTLTDRFGH